jgi:hypothetical protein
MYGLAAIQQANGWAMAGAGACIVLFGLAVLSFLISMIPRLTGLLEKKATPPIETPETAPQLKMIVPEKLPDDLNAAATVYISLTEDLGEDFDLIELHCENPGKLASLIPIFRSIASETQEYWFRLATDDFPGNPFLNKE